MSVQLPTSVRIGPFDFAVEDWDPRFASSAARFGECDKQQNIIRVRTDMPPQRIAEVLLHEINHAIWEVGACDELADEERVISAISMVWCQVWRDNPSLIACITKMVR